MEKIYNFSLQFPFFGIIILNVVKIRRMLGGMMMQKETTITIADDNVDFAQILNKFLSAQEGIKVVGIAYNGEEALDMIEKNIFRPLPSLTKNSLVFIALYPLSHKLINIQNLFPVILKIFNTL